MGSDNQSFQRLPLGNMPCFFSLDSEGQMSTREAMMCVREQRRSISKGFQSVENGKREGAPRLSILREHACGAPYFSRAFTDVKEGSSIHCLLAPLEPYFTRVLDRFETV